jgi:trehalose 6-phosphate phosphatase
METDEPQPFAPLDRAALFLDLDGTLAPIVATPEEVVPEARRTDVLARAQAALGGRLAVISGRTVEEVDRILEACGPHVAGIHGLDVRVKDRRRAADPHPSLADATGVFEALSNARAGVRVEPKPLSVALHYRQAPEAEPAITEVAERLADATGLKLQKGRMVVELKTPGADKGDAVRRFMADPTFAGAMPIFVGDDLTDEAGFAAAIALGGFGILVGPRRLTHARGRLDDPGAVLDWIEAALEAGGFDGAVPMAEGRP